MLLEFIVKFMLFYFIFKSTPIQNPHPTPLGVFNTLQVASKWVTLLEVLCIDLFGPVSTIILGGKKYSLVIVNDYTIFTWVKFLKQMNDAFPEFKIYTT